MAIVEVRIKHFRAYADTGPLRFGPLTVIVGKNDSGKSAIIHALQLFFEPPKKGGISVSDLHCKDESCQAEIEIAFKPALLQSAEIKVDAKNKIHVVEDRLVDSRGFLTLKAKYSVRSVEGFEIKINDVDFQRFYPLALKKHEELLDLLEQVGLPAKRAGKETNQEKRKALREYAISKGSQCREDWIDATAIEKPLRSLLPQFVFFTDSASYSIGENSVQNQFKGIADRVLSANPLASQIEGEIKNNIQTEFDKVFERLTRLTDTVTSMEAVPRVSWKKAIDGIGLSWGDALGISLPYELRGAGIRRLFMVAYLQYEAAESLHELNGPKYVFAIEEPEVHLHPGAQRDLETALIELSQLGHSVVFTTHSPVFASSVPIDDLILVTRSSVFAEAKQTPSIDIAQVAKELGVEASDRLIGKNCVVLVEGPHDVEFYSAVLEELFRDNLTLLDPNSILFLQCGGTSNLKFSVTTGCMDEAGLKWGVILDSDKDSLTGPCGLVTQRIVDHCPPTCSCMAVLERTAIENYLDENALKQITGIECQVPPYGKLLGLNGQPLGEKKMKQIKGSVAAIAKAMGSSLIVARSQNQNGHCEWISIFQTIKDRFSL